MKKIYSFLFAATALFAAVSCQKEVAPEVEAPKGEKITFTASTEVETKTALHENGKSTIWVAGDQISVFDANKEGNNRCFNIDALSEDAKTSTFSYEGEFVKDQSGMADPTVVALYPYQPKAYCDFFYYDRNYITGINFPAEQTAVAGSFDPKAAFALGLGTMNEKVLGFQNLYALLKFTVRDAGVKKVTVKVNEGAYIAGDAKIQMVLNTGLIGNEEGKPVFESPVLSIVENGSNTITLTCENAEEEAVSGEELAAEGFDTEATYYVAVAPATIKSIAVYFDDNETPIAAKPLDITLEANKIYNLKDLGSPKLERGLAFAGEAYTVTIGNKFTAPELKGETEGVVYSSSDESIASVNPETGAVTLNKVGSVTITAKAEESRYYKAGEASYILHVEQIVKVSRDLSFSKSSVTIYRSEYFTAPELSGYTDGVVYDSNNKDVAVVDSKTGEVTITGTGRATITASAEENDNYLAGSASYVLIVEEDPMPIYRRLSFSDYSISVTIVEDVTPPTLTCSEGSLDGVVYSSSDENVASVDKTTGNITVNGVGTTRITATVPQKGLYQEESTSYTLEVKTHSAKLYVKSEKTGFEMNIYAWESDGTPITNAYPGSALSWDESKEMYYYEFTLNTKEKTIKYLVNVNGDDCKGPDQEVTLSNTDCTYELNWKWLYLKPNSNWKQASAKFAAYFFTKNQSGEYWQWMMKLDTNHYGCVIPGDYKNVIFCRMNSSATNMNWDNKWNQTGDLTVPTNGNNLFTLSSSTWDGATTTWSKKTF